MKRRYVSTKKYHPYSSIAKGYAARQRRERIRLTVWGILISCFLISLESTVCASVKLPFLHVSPGRPWLGLLFVMAAGFLMDEEVGGLFGLIGGFLADAATGQGIMLHPLGWLVIGFCVGWLGRRILAHNLLSFLVFCLVCVGLEAGLQVIADILNTRTIPPVAHMWTVLVPCGILTFLCAPAVYGIVKLVFVRKKKKRLRGFSPRDFVPNPTQGTF